MTPDFKNQSKRCSLRRQIGFLIQQGNPASN